jgi:hypothetical protein
MEAKCQRLDRWEGKEKNERYMLLREERRRKGGGREGKGEREEKRERSKRSGEKREENAYMTPCRATEGACQSTAAESKKEKSVQGRNPLQPIPR